MSDPKNAADAANPNNDAYWVRRGYARRPKNWKQIVQQRGDAIPSPASDVANPNNDAYWQRLGYPKRPKNWRQLLKRPGGPVRNAPGDVANPNNDAFWIARGFARRPDDWEKRFREMKDKKKSRRAERHRRWSEMQSLMDTSHLGPLSVDDY